MADLKNGKKPESCVPSEADLPAGTGELPADGTGFVALVDSRVSLAAAWERLVRAGDLKISQRAVEKLTELQYKATPAAAQVPLFEMDVTPLETETGLHKSE